MRFGDVAGGARGGRALRGWLFFQCGRSRDSERSAQGLSQGAREWAGGHGAEGEGRSAARSPRRISRQCRFGGGKGLNSGGLYARGPGFLAGQSAEPVPDLLLRPDAHSELDDLPDCQVSTVQVRHPAVGPFASVADSTSLLELLGIHAASFLTAFSSSSNPSHLFSSGLYQ
jgi:hypothetical protein